MFRVGIQLLFSMREGKSDGLGSTSESCRPVVSTLDESFSFCCLYNELSVSQATLSLLNKLDTMEGREDLVEIDGLTTQDFVPLVARETVEDLREFWRGGDESTSS